METQELRDLIAAWAHDTAKTIGTDGIYLFGSLVYRDGTQFTAESDVDLAIVFPTGAKGAVARKAWLEQLLSRKIGLENELAKALGRSNLSEPVCSVIVLSPLEIGADIHKDGAEGFLGNNRFLNLLDGSITDKFPGVGEVEIGDRLIRQCLRFAQKKRNVFLAVAADGKVAIEPFAGVDPIPKDVMRHAAMAAPCGRCGWCGIRYASRIGFSHELSLRHARRRCRLWRLASLGFRATRGSGDCRSAHP